MRLFKGLFDDALLEQLPMLNMTIDRMAVSTACCDPTGLKRGQDQRAARGVVPTLQENQSCKHH